MKAIEKYQPLLSTLQLLPAPDANDLVGLSHLSRCCSMQWIGGVGERMGNINKPLVAPRDEIMSLGGIAVPRFEDRDPLKIVIGGYCEPEKVIEDVIVMEGMQAWDEQEGKAFIEIEFNPRWTAAELARHSVYLYYELLCVLSHEIAHALDPWIEGLDAPYSEAKGQKYEHQYLFDEAEVRARAWSGLAVYACAYFEKKYRFEEDVPALDEVFSAWWDFIDTTPIRDEPVAWFNSDNREEFVELLVRYIGAIESLATTDAEVATSGLYMPSLSATNDASYFGLLKFPGKGSTITSKDPQFLHAANLVAEHVTEMVAVDSIPNQFDPYLPSNQRPTNR